MRFNCYRPVLKKKDRFQWHPWFAWYPVRLEDERTCVWLETIQRRRVSDSWEDQYWWQYRE